MRDASRVLKRAWRCMIAAIVAMAWSLAACTGATNPVAPAEEGGPMSMQLTSPAFADGANIPTQYTCDGDDSSPSLRWSNVPAGAKSVALIADDPDAPGGTWVHWVMYGIPANVGELPEGVSKTETLPNGARQGMNDFKRIGYGGPCPPAGSAHRYFFKLYALDSDPALKPGATKQDLLNAMKGHMLAQGQLMGKYQRR